MAAGFSKWNLPAASLVKQKKFNNPQRTRVSGRREGKDEAHHAVDFRDRPVVCPGCLLGRQRFAFKAHQGLGKPERPPVAPRFLDSGIYASVFRPVGIRRFKLTLCARERLASRLGDLPDICWRRSCHLGPVQFGSILERPSYAEGGPRTHPCGSLWLR